MLNQAINICITGINAAFGFFDRIMSAIPGAFSFILAMIGVFTVFRVLLVPILGAHIGGAGSDMAHIIRAEDDRKNAANERFYQQARARAAAEKRHKERIADIEHAKAVRNERR